MQKVFEKPQKPGGQENKAGVAQSIRRKIGFLLRWRSRGSRRRSTIRQTAVGTADGERFGKALLIGVPVSLLLWIAILAMLRLIL